MIRSSMRRYHTYPPHRVKGALCGPVGTHRAPIGALCEGSSMRLYKAILGLRNVGKGFILFVFETVWLKMYRIVVCFFYIIETALSHLTFVCVCP